MNPLRPGRRRVLAAAGLALLPRVAAADETVDVAIVGAGLAGLTAARVLIAARKKVLVLEARDRIGGRTFTDASAGFAFDSGAAWIAPGPLAKELGARLLPGPEVGAIVLDGKPLTAEQQAAFKKSADQMAAYLKEVRTRFPDATPAQVLHPSQPLDQLAFVQLADRPPYDRTNAVDGGIGAAVARWGAKVPVKTGTRVLRFDSTRREVEIVTTKGAFLARSVIVTLPLGVLNGGHVGFAPPLSQKKRDALAAGSMASSMQVGIAFAAGQPKAPANAWLSGLAKAGLAFEALVRPQDRDLAIVVLNGYAARQIEEQGASASTAFALTALAEVYGNDLRAAFRASVASRWGHDPFALGAWSLGARGVAEVLAAPHDGRILFAGEATEERSGTIEAAYASGLRSASEAKALLR
jgi:monoamine oxidase